MNNLATVSHKITVNPIVYVGDVCRPIQNAAAISQLSCQAFRLAKPFGGLLVRTVVEWRKMADKNVPIRRVVNWTGHVRHSISNKKSTLALIIGAKRNAAPLNFKIDAHIRRSLKAMLS